MVNCQRERKKLTLKIFMKCSGTQNQNLLDDNKTPTRADYLEKREIDRSISYSFDGPFQLLYVDVGNFRILERKSATIPQYALVFVDLYLLKVYVYLIRASKQITQKMKLFYDEVKSEKKINV